MAERTGESRQPRALSCAGIAKRFAGRPALAPVSFELEPGEHMAITGPSGAGKTTLLRILAGLLLPSAGSVSEAGNVVCSPERREPPASRRLGFLFQGLALWPHLTVGDNVLMGAGPAAPFGGRSGRSRRVREVLAEVGLDRAAQRYPGELSGGERQRAAWARAVVGNPRLLLLDEPLTSLDRALQRELLDLVLAFGSAPGKTIVLATHDEEAAAAIG